MFIKGKKELLKFIQRNQKKRKHINAQVQAQVLIPRTQSEIVEEVQRLQAQQQRLNTGLEELYMRAETEDLSSQKMLTRYYIAYVLTAH